MFQILQHDVQYVYSEECEHALKTFKKALISAPIMKAPDWIKPFDLMCDASDFAIGVVIGQWNKKVFHIIYYASMTLIEAQINYTITKRNC